MNVYPTDIEVEDMSEFNPWHSAFYAAWKRSFASHMQFAGSPLGRGETKGDAISDLIRRTSDENNVEIDLIKATA